MICESRNLAIRASKNRRAISPAHTNFLLTTDCVTSEKPGAPRTTRKALEK